MPKGKYYGPDKYKGVVPKGYKGAHGKYFGPEKYKGLASGKTTTTTKKTTAKKTDPLLKQAQDLGTGKYAPALSQISTNIGTNKTMYDTASKQRIEGLNREIGSIKAAGTYADKEMVKLGESSQSAYQQAMSSSQKSTNDLLDKLQANNSNLLSSLQADMRDRGMDNYEMLSPLTTNMGKNSELVAAMGKFSENSLNAFSGLSRENTTSNRSIGYLENISSQSRARGQAQSELSDLYNKYLEAKLGLEGDKTRTMLEKQDYINQTYLTLKDRAAQEKAAKAAAKGQAAAAAANLQYKYDALKMGYQYKYDALGSKTAQDDITNAFKEKGFAHKQAMDLANLAIKKAQSQNKPGQTVDMASIIASMGG